MMSRDPDIIDLVDDDDPTVDMTQTPGTAIVELETRALGHSRRRIRD